MHIFALVIHSLSNQGSISLILFFMDGHSLAILNSFYFGTRIIHTLLILSHYIKLLLMKQALGYTLLFSAIIDLRKLICVL